MIIFFNMKSEILQDMLDEKLKVDLHTMFSFQLLGFQTG